MKKLQIISEKIESSNNNYFGRGSFETIIKNNKELVLSWFESLLSIQNQIRILTDEYECENLQKRNYVRIITKLFPSEYNQFVSINILLRDIDSITLAFLDSNDSKKQYELLRANNRLKFPGKHKKYVDLDIYQQFIILYSHDLIEKSQEFETEERLDIKVPSKAEKIAIDKETEEELKVDKLETSQKLEETPREKEEKHSYKVKETLIDNTSTKDKTNWMNVLLKGI